MTSQEWWVAKGFAEEPRSVIAKGDGGPINLAFGSFFAPLKLDSVSRAELHLNIITWGNRCYYVATYRVKRGTRMWIGKISHAEQDIARRDADQVFIEQPWLGVELVKDVEPLRHDLFVSPRAGRA